MENKIKYEIMKYFEYLLVSRKYNRLFSYVGITNDLKKRVNLHNSSKGAKFTRGRKWKLIYKEKHRTKSKAISREYYIKKNRKLIRNYKL